MLFNAYVNVIYLGAHLTVGTLTAVISHLENTQKHFTESQICKKRTSQLT